mgnify:CR=1 FL=1
MISQKRKERAELIIVFILKNEKKSFIFRLFSVIFIWFFFIFQIKNFKIELEPRFFFSLIHFVYNQKKNFENSSSKFEKLKTFETNSIQFRILKLKFRLLIVCVCLVFFFVSLVCLHSRYVKNSSLFFYSKIL